MPQKILNVSGTNYTPYEAEAQQNVHLGGACVARMVFNSHKVNPTANVPDAVSLANQQAMYTELRNRRNTNEGTDTWYVDPDAMRLTLHDIDTGPRGYVEYSYTNKTDLNNKLIYTINTYEVAPAVLVGASNEDYWVAVVGYSTDERNALLGFHVHDPSWDAGLPGFYYLSAATWNDVYLKVVGKGTKWLNKYVSVCDPEPETAEVGPARRIRKRPGDRIIPAEEVLGLVREGIEDHGLGDNPAIRAALRGTPGTPRLVQLLDQPDTQYYLLSFEAPGGTNQTLGRAVIDARYGDFVSIAASEEPWRAAFKTPAQVHRGITNRPITVPRALSRVRDRLVGDLSHLLERPSSEDPRTRARRLRDIVEEGLVSVRQPTTTVVLRPETTEVSRVLVATSARPYTLLSPSYRVTSGSYTLYVRALRAATSLEAVRLPNGGWDDPWWEDPATPLGG